MEVIQGRAKSPPKWLFAAVGLLGLAGASVAVGSIGYGNHHTPAGHQGYIRTNPFVTAAEFVGVQTGPTSTGMVWRQQVVNIDMRARTFSEEMKILTAERLELHFTAHARIRLRDDSVKALVEEYGGENWYEANVQQQFRSIVRSKVQSLEAFDVKSQMGSIAQDTVEELQDRYKDTPVEFLSVNIGNIQYPQVVVQSVVRKFVTNEDNERKDIELEIAQRQIDIGIAEAQGVADAQRVIRTSLDPMFLQYEALKAVEELAESPNTTFVIMPTSESGNAPLILDLKE
jgi:regulator of protease activity HflC (stomatin/prohibitin superfamily)